MLFPRSRHHITEDGKQILYRGVFPRIDLVVYRSPEGFEYDWVLAPGADPASIVLLFDGDLGRHIDPAGNLIQDTASGAVRHGRPVAYQRVDGIVRPVAASFVLDKHRRLRFHLGAYDKRRPLIIDPTLSLMSGIGGSGFINSFLHPYLQTDFASGMGLDGTNNIYLAGFAYSTDFPLVNQHPVSAVCSSAICACPSSFVAKLTPDARNIVYSTFLTACSESPPVVAVDAAGNAYVAGTIGAGERFVQTGGGTVAAGASSDVFLAKLDASGNLLATLTFAGSAADAASAIALGPDGKLYVAGVTASADFPVSANALHKTISSGQDIFLMKLDPTLLAGSQVPASAVLYSTFLGPGSSPAVAADAAGNAYVAASTTSGAWMPTANVVQPACSGRNQCADVIALKIDPTGSRFLYTTYLGGSGTEHDRGNRGRSLWQRLSDRYHKLGRFPHHVRRIGSRNRRRSTAHRSDCVCIQTCPGCEPPGLFNASEQ